MKTMPRLVDIVRFCHFNSFKIFKRVKNTPGIEIISIMLFFAIAVAFVEVFSPVEKKMITPGWIAIENTPAPADKIVWMAGYKEGKDVVEPFLGYYCSNDHFYYDAETGIGHSWITHWKHIKREKFMESKCDSQN